LRKRIPFFFLFTYVLLTPFSAQSQTRFFESGDSGVTATIDMVWWQNYGNRIEYQWGAQAAYIYKGLFDVGGGFEMEPNSDASSRGPLYLFAKAVVIQPKSQKGIGLELSGRYTSWTRTEFSFPPNYGKHWDRSYATRLGGFFRNIPANLIIGLGGIYTFNKYQRLDQSGEVLHGHDFGEVGFDFDIHYLAGRKFHFSLVVGYAQNNKYSFLEDWQFSLVLSAGVLFGLNPEQGGDVHEE